MKKNEELTRDWGPPGSLGRAFGKMIAETLLDRKDFKKYLKRYIEQRLRERFGDDNVDKRTRGKA